MCGPIFYSTGFLSLELLLKSFIYQKPFESKIGPRVWERAFKKIYAHLILSALTESVLSLFKIKN